MLGAAAYDAVRGDIDAVLAGQRVSYERLVPYENGSRWTSTEFIPDVGRDGVVRGFVAMVTDITERKHAEEEVRKIQEQLLFSDRLSSIGTLAIGVAHHINNPLTIVIANQDYGIGTVARLLSECSTSISGEHQPPSLCELKDRMASGLVKVEESLRDARQAAERVRRIVRDLEVFSAPQSGRRARVDVHAVLASAIEMLSDDIRYHGHLVKDYAPVPPVEGNEALLAQVFLHLLVNAAEAIHDGDPAHNEIRVTTRADNAGHVIVEVRDTGRGIPADHLGRIFDPFFTTKPVGKGTGLGLWVSGRILAELGGVMTVESQVGKGSTFTVTLSVAPL